MTKLFPQSYTKWCLNGCGKTLEYHGRHGKHYYLCKNCGAKFRKADLLKAYVEDSSGKV